MGNRIVAQLWACEEFVTATRLFSNDVAPLRLAKPGQQVKLVVVRGGERVTLEATLGSR